MSFQDTELTPSPSPDLTERAPVVFEHSLVLSWVWTYVCVCVWADQMKLSDWVGCPGKAFKTFYKKKKTFFLNFFSHATYGILVSPPGIEPSAPALEG